MKLSEVNSDIGNLPEWFVTAISKCCTLISVGADGNVGQFFAQVILNGKDGFYFIRANNYNREVSAFKPLSPDFLYSNIQFEIETGILLYLNKGLIWPT